jgi:ligand-binding SRPBCC domain-containing protein
MTIIKFDTHIEAPIERVFDLARSIDLHKLSTTGTNEEAVAGRTQGLIEINETVTWRAKHFGIYQNLTVQVTKMDRPNLFADRMISGAFSTMEHNHLFAKEGVGTKMTDIFQFTSPFGFIGDLANRLFLKKYMTKFLKNKNKELNKIAESEDWKKILIQK